MPPQTLRSHTPPLHPNDALRVLLSGALAPADPFLPPPPTPHTHDSKGKAPAAPAKGALAAGHPELLTGGPWIEKFRPAGLSDLVAHEEIIAIRECGESTRGEGRSGWCGPHIHGKTPKHTPLTAQ